MGKKVCAPSGTHPCGSGAGAAAAGSSWSWGRHRSYHGYGPVVVVVGWLGKNEGFVRVVLKALLGENKVFVRVGKALVFSHGCGREGGDPSERRPAGWPCGAAAAGCEAAVPQLRASKPPAGCQHRAPARMSTTASAGQPCFSRLVPAVSRYSCHMRHRWVMLGARWLQPTRLAGLRHLPPAAAQGTAAAAAAACIHAPTPSKKPAPNTAPADRATLKTQTGNSSINRMRTALGQDEMLTTNTSLASGST